MRRFFINESNKESAASGKIVIEGSDRNHIVNVLRLGKGDSILLCRADGTEFTAEISNVTKSEIICTVLNVSENNTEPFTEIILIQGIPKGEKTEFIIQKTVELGVNTIIPVITERTVVRFHDIKDEQKKEERWRKISEEASKQCGRGIIPKVENIIRYDRVFDILPENALRLIAYENEENYSLKHCLKDYIERNNGSVPESIVIIIGPEGGISLSEHEMALKNGFVSVTLGKRILRTETAGLAAIAGIRYELED